MILSGENVLNDRGNVNTFVIDETGIRIRTQDDQVTSAPKAVKVPMRTAVWIVLSIGMDGLAFVKNGRRYKKGT